mmetsp:Transcript_7471/g.16301  ORF Transcript_7471/g.16301 Transcript_7471/m.16301 type:complete len:99 (-) Transcript_7471:820-1116(-)
MILDLSLGFTCFGHPDMTQQGLTTNHQCLSTPSNEHSFRLYSHHWLPFKSVLQYFPFMLPSFRGIIKPYYSSTIMYILNEIDTVQRTCSTAFYNLAPP